MGTKACQICEDNQQQFDINPPNIQPITVIKQNPIKRHKLSASVNYHLEDYKPFHNQLPMQPILKKFGDDIYEGKVNSKGKPDGYGKMFYSNGNVFVGLLVNGSANGLGHYVLKDGSYYHGMFVNNIAKDDSGEFVSNNWKYTGAVKENMIDGKGREEGPNFHFEGEYKKSKRVYGKLKWSEKQIIDQKQWDGDEVFVYEGWFDEDDKFTKNGKLINNVGEYIGNFQNGMKEGHGKFTFSSGGVYEGEYKKGLKHGVGTLYGKNGKISFSGDWKNGLPNGDGFIINSFGDKIHLNWIDGLDQRILPDEPDQFGFFI